MTEHANDNTEISARGSDRLRDYPIGASVHLIYFLDMLYEMNFSDDFDGIVDVVLDTLDEKLVRKLPHQLPV